MKYFLLASVAALAPTAFAAEIPAGTRMLLRLEHNISTRTAKTGDGVYLRTVTPLSAGGQIVVPAGSYAQGTVIQTQRSRRAHKQGELQIQLVTLLLPSGEVLSASSRTSSIEGEDGAPLAHTHGADPFPHSALGPVFGPALAGAIVGGETGARVALGVGAAAIVISAILARGNEVELHTGATIEVVFDGPITLDR